MQPLISLLLQSTAFKPEFRAFKPLAASVTSRRLPRSFFVLPDDDSLEPRLVREFHYHNQRIRIVFLATKVDPRQKANSLQLA